MSKWFGMIGFGIPVEEEPGIWIDGKVIEKPFYGELLRNTNKSYKEKQSVNDDINLTNRISVLADPFLIGNVCHIRYLTFMGVKWKVNDIEFQHPRIVMSVGGVYNGEQA